MFILVRVILGSVRFAKIAQDAIVGILTIDPFKALTAEVMAMEGFVGCHESI
jgi:hypothetical protein